jgi:hypothetical protein
MAKVHTLADLERGDAERRVLAKLLVKPRQKQASL